jgi:hypothetical protein
MTPMALSLLFGAACSVVESALGRQALIDYLSGLAANLPGREGMLPISRPSGIR